MAARSPLNDRHHHQDRGQEAFAMTVLVTFGITLGTGLTLALLWIAATSIRATLQSRRFITEPPTEAVLEAEAH
ncbi:MAG: hypothetical protein DRI90_07935 [Deltaproteobacteria bacterium]|nr:MAG: hypothetical protein DRI90_07935 [Deltaproteobacteria bacterium]